MRGKDSYVDQQRGIFIMTCGMCKRKGACNWIGGGGGGGVRIHVMYGNDVLYNRYRHCDIYRY